MSILGTTYLTSTTAKNISIRHLRRNRPRAARGKGDTTPRIRRILVRTHPNRLRDPTLQAVTTGRGRAAAAMSVEAVGTTARAVAATTTVRAVPATTMEREGTFQRGLRHTRHSGLLQVEAQLTAVRPATATGRRLSGLRRHKCGTSYLLRHQLRQLLQLQETTTTAVGTVAAVGTEAQLTSMSGLRHSKDQEAMATTENPSTQGNVQL